MNHIKPTHSSHHSHVASHAHHVTAHTHHIAAHWHTHPTHVHAHATTTSTAVWYATTHATIHHSATVKAPTKVIHSPHLSATEITHRGWTTIASHGTAHVPTYRTGKVAVLEAHIIATTTVIEVPSVVVIEAIVVSALIVALRAAIITRRRAFAAGFLTSWNIFG